MKSNRDACLVHVFHDEGGYAERELEGGGAVNRGITFTAFQKHRKGQRVTFDDLKAMSKDEAAEIYDRQYLQAINFDKLPVGIDYVVLDSAINNGVGGATSMLREALGHKPEAGWDKLLWAARHRDPSMLINKFCDVRLARQKRFKNYKVQIAPPKPRTWGDAWDKRVGLVRKRALAMVGA